MKLTSGLVVVLASLLATASPASASKAAVKCESGFTPVDPVSMSPTVTPSMVPTPTPALARSGVEATSAPVESDTEEGHGVPVESDADEASAPEEDDSAEDDTSTLTPAPVAPLASASNDEVGSEYAFGDLNESAQQPPVPTAPASQSQTQTSTIPQDGVDPTTCLDAHNRARAEVGVAPLTWDAALASKGVAWAQHMADLDFFDHRTPNQADEQMNNLFSSTDCLAAVAAFVSEKPLLPEDRVVRQDGYKSYGHYSMMVWRATTRVGCGRGVDKNLVCYYETPGNTVGQAAY